MRRSNLFSLVLVVLGLLFVACGGPEGEIEEDDGADEVTGEAQNDLTKSKDGYYHYVASVQDVKWVPGCGVVRPGGTACYQGVVLTFTRQYGDLKTNIWTTVNQSSKTVYIHLDTYSSGTIHSMMAVRPQDEQLGTLNLTPGKTYKVVVVDYHRHHIWEGSLKPMLGM